MPPKSGKARKAKQSSPTNSIQVHSNITSPQPHTPPKNSHEKSEENQNLGVQGTDAKVESPVKEGRVIFVDMKKASEEISSIEKLFDAEIKVSSKSPKTSPTKEVLNDWVTSYQDLEQQFNRDMEVARKGDLEMKYKLREKHLRTRIAYLQEMQRISNEKALALITLMRTREEMLQREFQRILQLQQDKASNGSPQRQQSNDVVITLQPSETKKELPFFGLEIEECRDGSPGLRVINVTGPAAAGGIQVGDIISQMTLPIPTRSHRAFTTAVQKINPGDLIHFAVSRNGRKEMVFVTAGTRPLELSVTPPTPPAPVAPRATSPEAASPPVLDAPYAETVKRQKELQTFLSEIRAKGTRAPNPNYLQPPVKVRTSQQLQPKQDVQESAVGGGREGSRFVASGGRPPPQNDAFVGCTTAPSPQLSRNFVGAYSDQQNIFPNTHPSETTSASYFSPQAISASSDSEYFSQSGAFQPRAEASRDNNLNNSLPYDGGKQVASSEGSTPILGSTVDDFWTSYITSWTKNDLLAPPRGATTAAAPPAQGPIVMPSQQVSNSNHNNTHSHHQKPEKPPLAPKRAPDPVFSPTVPNTTVAREGDWASPNFPNDNHHYAENEADEAGDDEIPSSPIEDSNSFPDTN